MTRFAPEQLLEEAYKTYAQDKARFGNQGYPAYQGKTTAPMSSLTQKAREYQDRFAGRRAPYANKLNAVLNKPNEAFTPQQSQELINRLRQSQQGANENINLEALRRQFGQSFTPEREAAFRGQANQNIERGLGEFSGRFQDLNKAASNLEGVKNNQVAKRLQELQADKQLRRQGLIGNLEQFGNQKHANTNKVLASNQARFRQEAEDPQRRLEQLAATLEPIRNKMAAGPLHPDLERSTTDEIQRALQHYKAGNATYPGKMVAGLPPEMQASHNLLERINPSMKDSYSPQRKDIIRGFLGNETTGTRALQNVPGATQGKVTQLEEEARQRIQKDLAAINNRYTRLGQYGSPQHISEAERRAQEINKALLAERNETSQSALRNQVMQQHEGEIGNLKKLKTMASAGQQEHRDMFGNIRNLNNTGATKWRNEQDELEDLYKNYQNELNYGRPQLHPNVREAQQNEVFGNNEARDLNLNSLNNIKARYSELEKEPNQIQADIKSPEQFQAARAAPMPAAPNPAKAAADLAWENARRKAAGLGYMDLRKMMSRENPQHEQWAANEILNNPARNKALYDAHNKQMKAAAQQEAAQKAITDKAHAEEYVRQREGRKQAIANLNITVPTGGGNTRTTLSQDQINQLNQQFPLVRWNG